MSLTRGTSVRPGGPAESGKTSSRNTRGGRITNEENAVASSSGAVPADVERLNQGLGDLSISAAEAGVDAEPDRRTDASQRDLHPPPRQREPKRNKQRLAPQSPGAPSGHGMLTRSAKRREARAQPETPTQTRRTAASNTIHGEPETRAPNLPSNSRSRSQSRPGHQSAGPYPKPPSQRSAPRHRGASVFGGPRGFQQQFTSDPQFIDENDYDDLSHRLHNLDQCDFSRLYNRVRENDPLDEENLRCHDDGVPHHQHDESLCDYARVINRPSFDPTINYHRLRCRVVELFSAASPGLSSPDRSPRSSTRSAHRTTSESSKSPSRGLGSPSQSRSPTPRAGGAGRGGPVGGAATGNRVPLGERLGGESFDEEGRWAGGVDAGKFKHRPTLYPQHATIEDALRQKI